MGSSSAKLGQQRPVVFHLKTDPKGALQYGRIAEEVAKVYPELLVRNEAGRIDGVRYDELAPMLLNEVQQQQNAAATMARTIADQNEHIAAQAAAMRDLEQRVAELKGLKQELRAALAKLQPLDEFVVSR
jgi:phage shock protein A